MKNATWPPTRIRNRHGTLKTRSFLLDFKSDRVVKITQNKKVFKTQTFIVRNGVLQRQDTILAEDRIEFMVQSHVKASEVQLP